MDKIKSFQDLKIWQEAHSLCLEIYKITEKLPSAEMFGLTNQLRRSAASIAANIAEGMGRNTTKDFVNFLYNARGSLQETIYHLILARDLKYLKEKDFNALNERYNGLGAGINIFINKLKSQSLSHLATQSLSHLVTSVHVRNRRNL